MLRRIDYYFNVCGLRFVWVVFDSPEVDTLEQATRQRREARYLQENKVRYCCVSLLHVSPRWYTAHGTIGEV